MLSNFSFWIWGTIIAQFLTAFFHSLSFISPAKPRNETEKQLIDLSKNYKIDMGAGIKRSFGQLFIGVSTCFTMIYILGGVLNWFFLKSGISTEVWKGFLLIQLIAYGIVFFLEVRFTFFTSYNCYRPGCTFPGRYILFLHLVYLRKKL